MESAITTLFHRALGKKNSDLKQLFGGCWSVEERQEAYSKHSETKLAKGMFPQYVLLMKVNVKKYTVMSAVDIVIETIRRFMKSNIFCECYTLSFDDNRKNSKLYDLVRKAEHPLYKICKQLDFQKSYSETLDCLIADDSIYRIFMGETNKTKRELLSCAVCANIMFKNPIEKQT